ncbi:hypothetical protein A9Q99_21280 [Gammaproteobacteria bacterium 45_16_T64]|nr:hypothetical protein A9Q99_21280 [Gammaproteobacteria bacterium 45_16_T64]
MKIFYFILAGQAMSLLGTSLTNFGLSVWVYEQAGSVMDFTLVAVAGALPTLLFSPVAGALVDRWPRKKTLVIGQLGSALCTLVGACLYWANMLMVWHIIMLVTCSAVFMAFLRPGFTATITLLVGKDDLGKANGALATTFGLVQLIAPALAGALIHWVGLQWVFAINLLTFVIGIAVLLAAAIPLIHKNDDIPNSSIASEIKEAWLYLRNKPGLLMLLALTAAVNFNLAAIQVLVIPVVLGFANKAELGVVMSVGGAGMLFGGIFMMSWRGPKQNIHGVLSSGLIIALLIILFPIVPSTYVFAAGVFLAMAAYPVFMACSQSIWQRKVDITMQGRLFSFRNMVIGVVAPLAYVSSGFLADYVFEPLLMDSKKLSEMMSGGFLWLGDLYGYGPGRGVAAMVSVYGVVCFVCLLLGCMNNGIRNIDTDLPDAEDSDKLQGNEELNDKQECVGNGAAV